MQDVCDHAVSLRLSHTPSTAEDTGWFQLNWRNRQKFQDAKFLQKVNSVRIRHWIICREEAVKCHPAAQGPASVSLSLYENRLHGLSKKVFWFFSTEVNCMTSIPPTSPCSSLRPITTRQRQETPWHCLVPVNRREHCQGRCGGYSLSSICCVLSSIKTTVSPDFVSTLVAFLIFSVTPKTYLFMCLRGCRMYYCPPLTETPACNTIAFSLLSVREEAQGWVRAGAVDGKQVQVLSWIKASFSLEAVWITYLDIFPLQVLL